MPDAARTINLPLYLKSLEQMPDADAKEIAAAQKAFYDAYSGQLPAQITFGRGLKKGDGDIVAYQQVKNEDGQTYHTSLHLNENGEITNFETQFKVDIPKKVALYFITGLFGRSEITAGALEAAFKPARLSMPDVFSDVHPNPFKYLDRLSEGLALLYSCAEQKNSVEACMTDDGATTIAVVRADLEHDRAAYEKKVSDFRAELTADLVTMGKKMLRQELKRCKREAASNWNAAEKMREAARGWGDGDPDDIQKIMDEYKESRFSDDACERLRYSESMLTDIGNSEGGQTQFFKMFRDKCREISSRGHGCETHTVVYRCPYDVEYENSYTPEECEKREKPPKGDWRNL